ncbi:MAG: hypothetical protein K0R54_2281 [Clostridiaceae bacterium]|jgi:hypothetical protein|nr:hypothetical protein [Clostridiaceae bacterium]
METKKISGIYELNLPSYVLEDVENRIQDWLSMGGKEEDQYIQRQIYYALLVADKIENQEMHIFGGSGYEI